jgi:putative transposase
MITTEVTDTLNIVLHALGCGDVRVLHKPRLLSDNGSSYISGELADWLSGKAWITPTALPSIRRPSARSPIGICRQMPVDQGRRWHQTLKNRILLENYYLPDDLEQKIADFISHCNHVRYHESISNLTPTDVYFGRAQSILKTREWIKHKTPKKRRLHHRKQAA